ncbi:MAG TPA: hypothetical protein VGF94_01800 [Kofleriaceae bacterium]|jgi:hypothetical protein
MRALPLAVGVSAALHAAAFAWVTLANPSQPGPSLHAEPDPVADSVPAPVAVPDPDPILAIALLDDHTPDPIRVLDATALSHATSRGTSQISASHSGRTSEEPATGKGTGAGKGLMSMRGPEVSNGLSGDFIGRFLDSSKPLEPEPEPTGELHPSGNGTFVGVVGGDIDHPKDGVATMRVANDGTVKIEDAPDITAHWVKPLPFIAGKMAFDDAIMRHYGIDPYAAAKLQWLDKTRDERVRIGAAYRKEVLAHADLYMKQNLDAMWAATATADAAQRKRVLFQMWDEIAETGDDALVQAGVAARAYLVGFVRAHFPQTSADAFTAGELAQLNAHRTSKAMFAPYE